MTDSKHPASQDGFPPNSHPANAIDPDSDPLEDDELAALSGGNSTEAIALITPGDETVIVMSPQSF